MKKLFTVKYSMINNNSISINGGRGDNIKQEGAEKKQENSKRKKGAEKRGREEKEGREREGEGKRKGVERGEGRKG